MSKATRQKERARLQRQAVNERKARRQADEPAPTDAAEPTELPPLQTGDDVAYESTVAPGDEASDAPADTAKVKPESGYNASRRNAIKDGGRCEKVFPEILDEMIRERIGKYTTQEKPRTSWEFWLLTEKARCTVLVEVGEARLNRDMSRLKKYLSGPGWDIDGYARARGLASGIARRPNAVARALEDTRHGTLWLLYHLKGLAEVVQSKGGLDDAQRTLLFDVLGVPLPLRDGILRVPAGDDGPALAALIAREIARHEANLVNGLNELDQAKREEMIEDPSTYNDQKRRQLRSDLARAVKRLHWADAALEKLRHGVRPGTVIDPRTGQPITPDADADAEETPRSHRARSAASPPPSPSTSSASPADEETPATEPVSHAPFPDGCPPELREALQVFAGEWANLPAAVRAAAAVAAQPGAPPLL